MITMAIEYDAATDCTRHNGVHLLREVDDGNVSYSCINCYFKVIVNKSNEKRGHGGKGLGDFTVGDIVSD